MRLQDVLNRVACGAVSTGVVGDPVRFGLYLRARVLHGDCQAALAHHREVDDIISDEGRFGGGDSLFREDLPEDARFILNALVNVVDFQIARAEGDGFGKALRDDPSFQAC